MKEPLRAVRIIACGLLAVFIFSFRPALADQDESAKKDMLCANAPPGSVVKLPEMVAHWVVVLCTPSGHALAPEIGDKATIWVAQTNSQPFMLSAAPSNWKRPDSLSKYDMRFTDFSAAERKGDALQQTLKMWDVAFGHIARPDIERVIQLDARSVWQGTVYSLFFYVADGRPRWIIACVNQCNSAVPIKVVDLPGADARQSR